MGFLVTLTIVFSTVSVELIAGKHFFFWETFLHCFALESSGPFVGILEGCNGNRSKHMNKPTIKIDTTVTKKTESFTCISLPLFLCNEIDLFYKLDHI